jgi:hypothetical protein
MEMQAGGCEPAKPIVGVDVLGVRTSISALWTPVYSDD